MFGVPCLRRSVTSLNRSSDLTGWNITIVNSVLNHWMPLVYQFRDVIGLEMTSSSTNVKTSYSFAFFVMLVPQTCLMSGFISLQSFWFCRLWDEIWGWHIGETDGGAKLRARYYDLRGGSDSIPQYQPVPTLYHPYYQQAVPIRYEIVQPPPPPHFK